MEGRIFFCWDFRGEDWKRLSHDQVSTLAGMCPLFCRFGEFLIWKTTVNGSTKNQLKDLPNVVLVQVFEKFEKYINYTIRSLSLYILYIYNIYLSVWSKKANMFFPLLFGVKIQKRYSVNHLRLVILGVGILQNASKIGGQCSNGQIPRHLPRHILSWWAVGVSFITETETHRSFRFHETILSFGEPGSLGNGIPFEYWCIVFHAQ